MKMFGLLIDSGPFFVSVAVFLVGLWFSWWQVRIARERLRHDLYDRRFKVYEAVKELLIALVDKGDTEVRRAFQNACIAALEAPFLFNDSRLEKYLKDLLDELRRRVMSNIMFLESSARAKINDPQGHEEVARRSSELASAKAELATRYLESVPREFARFLKLTDFWQPSD
jgi:hypothetical protein